MKRLFGVIAFLLLLSSHAFALYDVPGNGIDEDGAGGDAVGLANDADLDGYTTDGTHLGFDCDDTNPLIIPETEITAGCSAGQWKTCQTNGTYTACGNACPSGTCYHADPVGGNNSNAGTSYAAAFLDWSCVSSYATGAPGCNVHSSLPCGSHIYLHAGTHSQMHAESGYNKVGLLLKNKACVANPITIHLIGAAIVDLGTTTADQATAIAADTSSGIIIKANLGEIKDIHSTGSAPAQELGAISCLSSDDFRIIGGIHHENLGFGDNNPAAARMGTCTNVLVSHAKLYNQINTSGNSANNCLLELFNGSAVVRYSMFGYSSTFATGSTPICGVRYKHGAFTGSFWFHHNRLSQATVISAAPGELIENNIFADVATAGGQTCGVDTFVAIGECDNGGPVFDGAQVARNNTILGGHAYGWNPNNDYDNAGLGCSNCGTFGSFAFTNSVVIDPDTFFSRTDGIGNVDNYGTDADYGSIITGGKMNENNNCYHDPGSTAQWSWYGQTTNPAGDFFPFTGPKPTGFCSTGCFDEDPALNSKLQATSSNCANYGWQNGWLNDSPVFVSAKGNGKKKKAPGLTGNPLRTPGFS